MSVYYNECLFFFFFVTANSFLTVFSFIKHANGAYFSTQELLNIKYQLY